MDTEHAPTSARALATAEVRRRIVAESRRQLGIVGPGQLSLRAVARELGMASSAIYRHFASRDELVTTLITAAYDELAELTDAAVAALADHADPADRWRAWCRALRGWAVSHPHDYALIYGSPIPGYAAPDTTTTSALRVLAPIIALFPDITVPGEITMSDEATEPDDDALTRSLAPMTSFIGDLVPEAITEDPTPPSPAAIARGIGAWSTIMGFVSLDLFGHLTGGVADADAVWARVVEQTAADLGLVPEPGPVPDVGLMTEPGPVPEGAAPIDDAPADDAPRPEGSLW
ncbi:TetR/AcrR family transcriptional regulator [Georgenia sp. Z1344]|uniref:TetR/AcrR family transcriptional regulator n=1 Tax=Georgenia sp. Z1344 TaxID=3416706 RepID=UPI003CEAC4EA